MLPVFEGGKTLPTFARSVQGLPRNYCRVGDFAGSLDPNSGRLFLTHLTEWDSDAGSDQGCFVEIDAGSGEKQP